MTGAQKLIVVLALVLIVVTGFFAPYAYSIPSDVAGQGPYVNVVYAPLWAAPAAQTLSGGPVQGTFPAQLLVVRLLLWWLAILAAAWFGVRWVRSRRLRGA